MAGCFSREKLVEYYTWTFENDFAASAGVRSSFALSHWKSLVAAYPPAADKLREMADTATREQKQAFKALNFEYVTFSGIFSYRNARSLVERSPFLTLDIDDLASMEEARELQQLFIQDKELKTALCFVSPKGRGVKWIVELPDWTLGLAFRDQFETMRRNVGFRYGYDPDKSGSDVCRACYLPWDADCYVNPKYLSLKNNV